MDWIHVLCKNIPPPLMISGMCIDWCLFQCIGKVPNRILIKHGCSLTSNDTVLIWLSTQAAIHTVHSSQEFLLYI